MKTKLILMLVLVQGQWQGRPTSLLTAKPPKTWDVTLHCNSVAPGNEVISCGPRGCGEGYVAKFYKPNNQGGFDFVETLVCWDGGQQ